MSERISSTTEARVRIARDIVIALCAVAALFLYVTVYLLPAPYNLGYLFKCAFYTPKYVCQDGIYSFAATPSGACSGHGGVRSGYRP